jgi:hypothetical protein
VPAALEEVIHRCLSFRREERPATAEDLDAMLESCAVVPAWTTADAKAWWHKMGPGAFALAAQEREERRERGQFLMLSSDHSARS